MVPSIRWCKPFHRLAHVRLIDDEIPVKAFQCHSRQQIRSRALYIEWMRPRSPTEDIRTWTRTQRTQHSTHRMNYSRCNAQDHETFELRISLKLNARLPSRINTELSGHCNRTDWAREEMRNLIVVDIPAITWHPNQFLSQVNLSPFHSTQRMCLLLFAIAIIISCVNNISINHTHTHEPPNFYKSRRPRQPPLQSSPNWNFDCRRSNCMRAHVHIKNELRSNILP